MRLIGNVIWFVFGGVIVAFQYFFSSIAMMLTIVGIPFGIQTMKIGVLALWPFGRTVKPTVDRGNPLYILMNVLWLLFGGFCIALTHAFFGILFFITIIGIPFGKQHFKLAALSLTPFGHQVVKE